MELLKSSKIDYLGFFIICKFRVLQIVIKMQSFRIITIKNDCTPFFSNKVRKNV